MMNRHSWNVVQGMMSDMCAHDAVAVRGGVVSVGEAMDAVADRFVEAGSEVCAVVRAACMRMVVAARNGDEAGVADAFAVVRSEAEAMMAAAGDAEARRAVVMAAADESAVWVGWVEDMKDKAREMGWDGNGDWRSVFNQDWN